jgi:hypothetical protein
MSRTRPGASDDQRRAATYTRVAVEERVDHVALPRHDAREVGQDVVGRPRIGEVAVQQQPEAEWSAPGLMDP